MLIQTLYGRIEDAAHSQQMLAASVAEMQSRVSREYSRMADSPQPGSESWPG